MKATPRKRKTRGPKWTPFKYGHLTPEQMEQIGADSVVLNSRYQVYITRKPWPSLLDEATGEPVTMTHLSIKRRDRNHIHDWRELQRIKNELVGEDAEAVELYPAESRLVDGANQYHLWCLPPGLKFPIGFFKRSVSESEALGNKQRPFEKKPDDLKSDAEVVQLAEVIQLSKEGAPS